MKLEHLILGLLKINPRTGYDIKKYLDTEGRFGRARPPLSQIYTTLKRMVENGWVFFEEKKREGKPDLKIYYPTEEGERVFQEFLRTPIEPPFRYFESDIYYRVMFAFFVEPEVTIKQLEKELNHRREQIATFRHRDRSIQSSVLTEEELAYAQDIYELLHRGGARSIDLYVSNLEKMIAYFKRQQESHLRQSTLAFT